MRLDWLKEQLAMPSLSQANSSLARCVMVLGTSSGAGKSWITTALCRLYALLGL